MTTYKLGSIYIFVVINQTPYLSFFFNSFQAGVTFVYMSFWECSLKRQRSVHWEDMTTVIDDDEVHKKLVRLKNK